ncbi:unnamed protein product [Dibothriocephalus latus]|uniref:Uncharacterized protein n=1 Tax=Dibothriocephalus latus TaxID=60516 RepID=A0A3P7LPJ6_DIBLA|nr:unnamed protein product [Dibothriocephalus latus]
MQADFMKVYDQKFNGRSISSAVKLCQHRAYSLLYADGLALTIEERLDQSLRTPGDLVRALWLVQATCTSSIDCPGVKKANDGERE